MVELTSQQMLDAIVRSLDKVNADFRKRKRLLRGLNLSPVTQRVLARLTTDEVSHVMNDLRRRSTR